MSAVIRGIKAENQVVEVRKMRDGILRCVTATGKTFVVPEENDVAQAIVIYTMLHAAELNEVRA